MPCTGPGTAGTRAVPTCRASGDRTLSGRSAPGSAPRLDILFQHRESVLAVGFAGRRKRLLVQLRDPLVLCGIRCFAREDQPHQAPRALAQHALAVDEELPEQRLRGMMALLGREVEPARGLARVLSDPGSLEIEPPEMVLRVRVAVVRSRVVE